MRLSFYANFASGWLSGLSAFSRLRRWPVLMSAVSGCARLIWHYINSAGGTGPAEIFLFWPTDNLIL